LPTNHPERRLTTRRMLKLVDYALPFVHNSLTQIADDVVACSSLNEIVILHQIVNRGSNCNPDWSSLKFHVWMCHPVYVLTVVMLDVVEEMVTDGLPTNHPQSCP